MGESLMNFVIAAVLLALIAVVYVMLPASFYTLAALLGVGVVIYVFKGLRSALR